MVLRPLRVESHASLAGQECTNRANGAAKHGQASPRHRLSRPTPEAVDIVVDCPVDVRLAVNLGELGLVGLDVGVESRVVNHDRALQPFDEFFDGNLGSNWLCWVRAIARTQQPVEIDFAVLHP